MEQCRLTKAVQDDSEGRPSGQRPHILDESLLDIDQGNGLEWAEKAIHNSVETKGNVRLWKISDDAKAPDSKPLDVAGFPAHATFPTKPQHLATRSGQQANEVSRPTSSEHLSTGVSSFWDIRWSNRNFRRSLSDYRTCTYNGAPQVPYAASTASFAVCRSTLSGWPRLNLIAYSGALL